MHDIDSPASSVPVVTRDLLCPRCGYNLRGLHEYRCPECGDPFDPAALSESQLPWTHRRRLGRVRAYWQTVELVVLHPKQLAAEMAHPCKYADSQRFRWITVGWVWLTLLLSTMFNWDGHDNIRWLLPDGGGEGLGMVVINHLAALAALAVITGVPSYFFHPRQLSIEQQNRAIDLSYYCSAVLTFCPVVLVLGWIAHGFAGQIGTFVVLLGLTAVQFVFWWVALLKLTTHGLRLNDSGRTIRVAMLIPLTQVVASVFVYVLVHYSLLLLAVTGLTIWG